MKKYVMTAVLAIWIASPVLANDTASAVASKLAIMAAKCTMTETVNVTVNYNFKAKSFAEAKKMFEDQNAKVAELAKQQKLAKFELQNQNYNIYSQPMNYGPDGVPQDYSYQVSGSSAYVMDNAEAAFKFAEFLSSQKIQVGLNSNSYKSGNCSNPVAAD